MKMMLPHLRGLEWLFSTTGEKRNDSKFVVTFYNARHMHSSVEPFYDETGAGILHSTMSAELYKGLREHALNLPKFGTDTADDEV